MTDLSRIDALKGLLERVQRNARSPRSLVPVAIDEPTPSVHLVTLAVPSEPLVEAPPESLAFDLVPAPKSAHDPMFAHRDGKPSARNGVNGFGDETTLSGSAEVVETLILKEQEEAARKQIRFEESVHRAPTTRPPPTEAAPPTPPAPGDEDDSPDILVLDELDLGGPATEPPSALVADPSPPSLRTPSLPDIDAIEADLMVSAESERTHHDLAPLDDGGSDEDETPSSVRKPRDVDRGEDVHFDGFEPISHESEPPPESGEVPSQRRVAIPHDERASSPDGVYAQGDLETSGVVPALSREDELDDVEEDDRVDGDDQGFDDHDERASDPLAMQGGGRAEWGGESGEIDVESTKEIRALGRVDVVERTPIHQPPDIVVLKGEPRATETFGAIFDEALSIGD